MIDRRYCITAAAPRPFATSTIFLSAFYATFSLSFACRRAFEPDGHFLTAVYTATPTTTPTPWPGTGSSTTRIPHSWWAAFARGTRSSRFSRNPISTGSSPCSETPGSLPGPTLLPGRPPLADGGFSAPSVRRSVPGFSAKSRNPNPSPTGKTGFGFLSPGRSGETRTRGLLLPKQARYQLRNTPVFDCAPRRGCLYSIPFFLFFVNSMIQ